LIFRVLLKHLIDIKTKRNTYRKIKVFHIGSLITKPINIEHQYFWVIFFNVNIGISFHMKTRACILLFFVIHFRVWFCYVGLLRTLRLMSGIIISIIYTQFSTRLFSWILLFPYLGHAVMSLIYTLLAAHCFAQTLIALSSFIKRLYFIYYFLSIN
jgi:hypothetical protein